MTRFRNLLACGAVLAVLLAVALDASAQRRPPRPRVDVKPIEPEGIVNTSWKVTISVNKQTIPVGDEVIVKVTSEQDGYLYLFNVVPNQKPICIFPNPYQKNNMVKAGQEVTVPDPGDRTFRLVAREPAGKEGLLAYVSKSPSQIDELKLENLTRGRGPKAVSRIALKRLIVVEGMGGKPEDVGGDKPQGPLTVQREKDKVEQTQGQQQVQGKLKEWASAVVEVEIVQGKVPVKDKPTQDKDKPGQDKDKTGQDKDKSDVKGRRPR